MPAMHLLRPIAAVLLPKIISSAAHAASRSRSQFGLDCNPCKTCDSPIGNLPK